MAFLRSTPGPAPCPACDAEFGSEVKPRETSACPVCGVPLHAVEAATCARRALAFAIDAGVLLLTAGPLALLLGRLVGLEAMTDGKGIDALLQVLAGDLWRPVGRAMPFLVMASTYFLLFGILRGQTLGQLVLGIRVVDAAGERPGIARSLSRVLAGWVSLIPAGLGALWMFFDLERRAFHDHVTATWVVRSPRPEPSGT